MKKKIAFFLIALTLNLAAIKCFAKQPFKNRGYLIYLDYTWFFQPCDDSTINFIESLNQASFRIIEGTDGHNNFLYEMEKILPNFKFLYPVKYRWHLDSNWNIAEVRYQFCELEYSNDFVTPNKNLHPCMYQVQFNKCEYNLGCFSFDVRVHNYKI